MSVHFDAIELNTNSKDYAENYYYDANASANIFLGEVLVSKNDFKDKFNTISKEDCINFTISKNDIIGINVTKYNDYYGEPIMPVIYLNTEELIPNKWTEYTKKNAALIKCRILYKVE